MRGFEAVRSPWRERRSIAAATRWAVPHRRASGCIGHHPRVRDVGRLGGARAVRDDVRRRRRFRHATSRRRQDRHAVKPRSRPGDENGSPGTISPPVVSRAATGGEGGARFGGLGYSGTASALVRDGGVRVAVAGDGPTRGEDRGGYVHTFVRQRMRGEGDRDVAGRDLVQ